MSKLALVTGGTRGIGAAIAHRLVRDGYLVAVTYHDNEAMAQAFTRVCGVPAYCWDVADFEACQAGVRHVEAELGKPVDVLINNAGITRDASLHKMTCEQWHAVLATDLTSCFNMCHAVIEGLRSRGWGRIVNVSSINGQKGQFGQSNYAAAKAGMIGFTKSLALESANRGITVNAVAPGYTATDMVARVDRGILDRILSAIPVGRLAQVEEIAHAVAFLVHADSGFITGSTLSVNGGQYLA